MLSLIALDFFRRSPMLMLPMVALAIFMLVFAVVTVRTLLRHKASYDHLANLPLDAGGDRD